MGLFDFMKKSKPAEEIKETVEEVKSAVSQDIAAGDVKSPLTGKVVDLKDVPDPVFSEKMMGDGVAINPESGDGIVYSPINGKVELVFETKHAVGLKDESGYEYLIHFGLETVNLGGKGFEAFVKAGDTVKVGDKLVKVDMEAIKGDVPSLVTPIIVTSGQKVEVKASGEIKAGEELFTVVE
jgi:glucose-specific phosphotransferase system IIA component